jgi:hypothetical protein
VGVAGLESGVDEVGALLAAVASRRDDRSGASLVTSTALFIARNLVPRGVLGADGINWALEGVALLGYSLPASAILRETRSADQVRVDDVVIRAWCTNCVVQCDNGTVSPLEAGAAGLGALVLIQEVLAECRPARHLAVNTARWGPDSATDGRASDNIARATAGGRGDDLTCLPLDGAGVGGFAARHVTRLGAHTFVNEFGHAVLGLAGFRKRSDRARFANVLRPSTQAELLERSPKAVLVEICYSLELYPCHDGQLDVEGSEAGRVVARNFDIDEVPAEEAVEDLLHDPLDGGLVLVAFELEGHVSLALGHWWVGEPRRHLLVKLAVFRCPLALVTSLADVIEAGIVILARATVLLGPRLKILAAVERLSGNRGWRLGTAVLLEYLSLACDLVGFAELFLEAREIAPATPASDKMTISSRVGVGKLLSRRIVTAQTFDLVAVLSGWQEDLQSLVGCVPAVTAVAAYLDFLATCEVHGDQVSMLLHDVSVPLARGSHGTVDLDVAIAPHDERVVVAARSVSNLDRNAVVGCHN